MSTSSVTPPLNTSVPSGRGTERLGGVELIFSHPLSLPLGQGEKVIGIKKSPDTDRGREGTYVRLKNSRVLFAQR